MICLGNNMNKIYLSITPFFPTSTSFRGPFILDQVRALQRNSEFRVVVLKPKPWYSKAQDYTYEGVQVYMFSTFELPSNILPGLFNAFSVWSFNCKLKKLDITPEDIAVAHAHVTGLGFFANALKKSNSKIKSVLQHHGFDVLSLENGIFRNLKFHRKIVKNYGIRVCNKIDLHVVVSKKTLECLRLYSDIEIKQSYVLYNGIDTSKFYTVSKKNHNKNFVIGCVANFWALKDQMTLIKAVEILFSQGIKDIEVKFVGTGPTLQENKNYVDKNHLGENVQFIDEIPNNKLINFYNSLDIFVLPSFYEAFGCVYIEAYACGVPFIAVKGQGISELMSEEEKEKWLIEKGDYKMLSILIQQSFLHKYDQKLLAPINVDTLIKRFLNRIAKINI